MSLVKCSDSSCPRPNTPVQHHARGLCIVCYRRKYERVRRRPIGVCANPTHLGQDRAIVARGLCRQCYNALKYSGGLSRFPKEKREPVF